ALLVAIVKLLANVGQLLALGGQLLLLLVEIGRLGGDGEVRCRHWRDGDGHGPRAGRLLAGRGERTLALVEVLAAAIHLLALLFLEEVERLAFLVKARD